MDLERRLDRSHLGEGKPLPPHPAGVIRGTGRRGAGAEWAVKEMFLQGLISPESALQGSFRLTAREDQQGISLTGASRINVAQDVTRSSRVFFK